MKLIDSNIILYAGKEKFAHLRSLLTEEESVVSVVTIMETLGYHNITLEEKSFLEGVFTILPSIPITTDIVVGVIKLRQRKNISLGDAIIAATALDKKCVLYTRNTKDFKEIEGLEVVNPIDE